jgi:hypothetical protein
VGVRSPQKLDSITGIQSLVKGGDNDISIHVVNVDSTFKGLSVVFAALLDTTLHFKPSGKFPFKQQEQEAAAPAPLPVPRDTSRQKAAPAAHEKKAAAAPAVTASPLAAKKTSHVVKYRSSQDVMKAVLEYQKKIEFLISDIKKERLEVQKLRIKNEDLDEQNKKVKEEIVELKKKPEETGKKK